MAHSGSGFNSPKQVTVLKDPKHKVLTLQKSQQHNCIQVINDFRVQTGLGCLFLTPLLTADTLIDIQNFLFNFLFFSLQYY